MCSERDCRIFRGMLVCCDACEKVSEAPAQMPKMLGAPVMGPTNMP